MALWSFYISDSDLSGGQPKPQVEIRKVNPFVASFLYLGARDTLANGSPFDQEVISKVENWVNAMDAVVLRDLTPEEFRRFYTETKLHYDDFVNERPPRFYAARLDDKELNRKRREYFDLFMKLLEEDPRLKDEDRPTASV